MGRVGEEPVPNTPAQAATALEAHLPVVLRGRTLEEAGWKRPDPLTLLIPVIGICEGPARRLRAAPSLRLLPRLAARCPVCEPRDGGVPLPRRCARLPRVEGTNEIAVHVYYDNRLQLVCASVTLEFYQVRHGVVPHLVWDANVQNFAATLAAVERGLRPPYYKGRQG